MPDSLWQQPMGGSGTYSYIKDSVPTCCFRTTHLGSSNPIITMMKPAESLVRKHPPVAPERIP
jgi:hypothetical protein